MLASAIALATLVTTAIPVAQAQGDQPPAATPIPLPEKSVEAPKAEPTAEPTAAASVEPQSTVILWSIPSGGTAVSINAAGQATVRVSRNDGDLDPATAKFQLAIDGVFQPIQNATAAAVGGSNATLDLTASGLGGVNTANTKILFKINLAGDGGAAPDSSLFSVTRNSRLGVPVMNRDSGVTSIPQTITQTGSNACDAFQNRRGGPLGSFVRYTVSNTQAESWFWAINPNPGASIAVSLTNYTSVAGQLQVVVTDNGGCTGTQSRLGFATNPNPAVSVVNVPRGLVFFRVVSGDGQPAPAPNYTISWGFGTGGGGGGGSGNEIEPNNNICQATPLPERATYTANDNDQFDFYSIAVPTSGQVMILVEGHNTAGTQVQVRAPFRYNGINEDLTDAPNPNCPVRMAPGLRKDPYTDPIGNVSSPGAQLLTRTGIVINGGSSGDNAGSANPPEIWYIRVATPNAGGQSGKQYTIRWALLPPGVTALPFPDKLTQAGPTHGPDPLLRANSTFSDNTREKWYYSFFWSNFNQIAGGAADTVQFALDSWTLSGCDANVFPPDPGRTVPAGFAGNFVTVSNQPSGAMTWKMNKSGAYRIRIRALRAGQVVRADEKAFRVDCGFQTYNFGGLWPLGNDNATPGSPLIGPEKPIDWVEPIP